MAWTCAINTITHPSWKRPNSKRRVGTFELREIDATRFAAGEWSGGECDTPRGEFAIEEQPR